MLYNSEFKAAGKQLISSLWFLPFCPSMCISRVLFASNNPKESHVWKHNISMPVRDVSFLARLSSRQFHFINLESFTISRFCKLVADDEKRSSEVPALETLAERSNCSPIPYKCSEGEGAQEPLHVQTARDGHNAWFSDSYLLKSLAPITWALTRFRPHSQVRKEREILGT